MAISRRQFLKGAALTGAAVVGGGALDMLSPRRAYPFVQSPTNIRKFVVSLPGLGPTAANEIGQYIPVATPDTKKHPGNDFYSIVMGQYQEKMHPDLPAPTKFWGYADATNLLKPKPHLPDFKYLGGVIVAQRDRPVRIDFDNWLPPIHPLPVDHTIPGAESKLIENRTCVHLHGGEVPWTSDGGPFTWTTPLNLIHGPDWQPGDLYYPNAQSARLVWYHDHAFGITRLNAYAGLASGYIIADKAEADLINSGLLPDIGIPLVIQDKGFVPNNILKQDPKWRWGSPGDLWYPHVYEPNSTASGPNVKGRWDWGPYDGTPPAVGTLALPDPSNVPEAFFDTTLINGACYPYLNVEPKRYRFRILNGANARFYNLQLYVADSSGKEEDINKPGPAFVQIGTEGGFLPAPAVFSTGGANNVNSNFQIGFDPDTGNANSYNLLLAPAERADVIIDFQGFEGATLILWSDAPAPFPGGDPRNDYFTGDADQTGIGGAPSTAAGFGPNTRTLMQIRVGGTSVSEIPFGPWLNALNAALPVRYAASQPMDLSPSGVTTFGKTLNEDFDKYGRLIQRLGTTTQNGVNNQGLPTWGQDYLQKPVTETASNGETQIWRSSIYGRHPPDPLPPGERADPFAGPVSLCHTGNLMLSGRPGHPIPTREGGRKQSG